MTLGPADAERAWRIEYSGRAEKDIAQLDRAIRTRVLTALARLALEPRGAQLRKLSGSDERRMRVGAWRVRFIRDTEQRVIYVTRVLPRGRAYDR